jgi:hypothetical protein
VFCAPERGQIIPTAALIETAAVPGAVAGSAKEYLLTLDGGPT